MTFTQVLKELNSRKNEKNVAGMAHFGIKGGKMLGISVTELRKLARRIKTDQKLAVELWKTGIHDGRILASIIADHKQFSEELMDDWVSDFDSWDICDQVCGNIFCYLPITYRKTGEWVKSDKEFVRRTAFSSIAYLAVHDKKASDADLLKFFPLIEKYSGDERNFMRKSVNWALRQIGKRNLNLNKQALVLAHKLSNSKDKTERWIGKDAVKELESAAVKAKLSKQK
jgi:3-methyladenine DNA glycosylase AlkD